METNSDKTPVIQWSSLLKKLRDVEIGTLETPDSNHLLGVLRKFAEMLELKGFIRESRVFEHVYGICVASPNYGGLGLSLAKATTTEGVHEIQLLLAAWLESLNSEDRSASNVPKTQTMQPQSRPPMNTTEKIFAVHSPSSNGYAKSGDTILVSIDWILASEASWAGMERTYNKVGKPGIFRNDRFWLAGDHVVDPRVYQSPVVKRLIESSENARKVFKMTEYQGMNYTIMHTEFFRERAQPGMLIIGSDSHTCSSGANGCLAIGLGAADVTMGLITGEIWFKIPDVINIQFVGRPAIGIGGKDIILYVLQRLKRNTVAADRIVEYSGAGLDHLSPDARFAIANMTTEFGGVSGIFVPDQVTKAFINSRRLARHRDASMYFCADENANYAETFEIDLTLVSSYVARYPNPDDVVSVTDMVGQPLDGCFIGACTTTEEDIILGALVLEQGLLSGWVPIQEGKTRKVVPGSRPILENLERLGLLAIYKTAGFEVGVPGCSYCVGMSADSAGAGEVWLSSQNRNFENRMGKGAIGHLASAATVAASSFNMTITDPQELIGKIPKTRWQSFKDRGPIPSSVTNVMAQPEYVHPAQSAARSNDNGSVSERCGLPTDKVLTKETAMLNEDASAKQSSNQKVVSGRIQRLGDFVDTDALAPAQFLVTSHTNEALGSHCLELTKPDFRQRAKDGFDIVVAGKAFGCGSSREQAVNALLGCGVKCAIAKSFAFIYSRNQPNLGLLGITITDSSFFEAAVDGQGIEVDLDNNSVRVADRSFGFSLSEIEKALVDGGGITPAFTRHGKEIFRVLCKNGTAKSSSHRGTLPPPTDSALAW